MYYTGFYTLLATDQIHIGKGVPANNGGRTQRKATHYHPNKCQCSFAVSLIVKEMAYD